MKKTFLILYFTLSGLLILAQNNTITLHPIVGDTIDKFELRKYFLFTEYTNDSTDYIVIIEGNNSYHLLEYYNNTLISRNQVSEDFLTSQKENIEKLNEYFATRNITDTAKINLNTDSISNTQVDLNINTPEFNKRIKKDNRHKYWQEKREERDTNQKHGMIY